MTQAETNCRSFIAWKAITIGTYKTVADLSEALKEGGFRVGNYAAQILENTPLVQAETTIILVKVTPRELGFNAGTRFGRIYERANHLGLALLPAEVGPQLRKQYRDQSTDEWIVVGMSPLPSSDGSLRIFHVACYGDEHWLDTGFGNQRTIWHPDSHWVFASPK